MSPTRMYELAAELLRLSQDNKLTWEQTLRANQFQVDFPDVSLAISRSNDTYDNYSLELINETGTTIDTLLWSPTDYNVEKLTNPDLQDAALEKIYELAESYVQGIVADRALQYLKQA